MVLGIFLATNVIYLTTYGFKRRARELFKDVTDL